MSMFTSKQVISGVIFFCISSVGCSESVSTESPDASVGHTDTDTDTDADSDTDTDTDSDTCDGPDELDINCNGGPLFDYGIASITIHYPDATSGQMYKAEYTYEYNDSKQYTTSTVNTWDSEGLFVDYQREYKYDASGRLTSIEWEIGSTRSRRVYEYDDQNRIGSGRYESETDGILTIHNTTYFDYGSDGKPWRRRYETSPDWGDKDHGDAFEYDEKGRLARLIHLEPENNWAETDASTEFEYDCLNRFISEKGVKYESSMEKVCSYVGNTGQLSECVTTIDDVVYVDTFTREGNSFTLTATEQRSGVETVFSETNYVYDMNADSSYHEMFPTPFYRWQMYDYGYGFINSCIGF